MSVKIDYLNDSTSYHKCAFCGYKADFYIHSSKVAGVYKSCGSLECQKTGTNQLKARVALVASDDDKPIPKKKEKKRERDTTYGLDEMDYDTLIQFSTEDLEYMCALRQLSKSGTKGQRARRLLEWRDNGQRSAKEVKDSYKVNDPVGTCIATKKDGSDCTSKATVGGLYCRRHIY